MHFEELGAHVEPFEFSLPGTPQAFHTHWLAGAAALFDNSRPICQLVR
jgi:hypothetical protein